jgi:predicted outer membrane protein
VLGVEAGKQALDKSQNNDVRAFAQRMVVGQFDCGSMSRPKSGLQ